MKVFRLVTMALTILLLGGLAASPAARADSRAVEMAAPLPDWDNPRKIVLQVSDGDPRTFEGAMSNAYNLQKFYGVDNVQLAILTFGPGVRNLMKESATAPERVSSLQDYGVEFIACGNTLDTLGKSEADLVAGVTVVSAGIAELVERSLRGWNVVVP